MKNLFHTLYLPFTALNHTHSKEIQLLKHRLIQKSTSALSPKKAAMSQLNNSENWQVRVLVAVLEVNITGKKLSPLTRSNTNKQ